MAEEGASELELPRINGGGLSNTAGQHQPLAPVTSSDPPPMSSSPRSGGDPDEEKGWSERLKKDCVSEIVSDQEQSNPLLLEEVEETDSCLIIVYEPPPPPPPPPRSGGDPGRFDSCITSDAFSNHEQASLGADEETDWSKHQRKKGHPVHASMAKEHACCKQSEEPLPSPLGRLNRAHGTSADLPQPDDRVSSDEEQGDPSYMRGEGLPSGVETIGGHIVDIVRSMKAELPRQLKKFEVQKEMIYRVPQISSSLDKDAYAPQFVSFGPYHRGTEALSSADKYKWFFLEQILNMRKGVSLRMYLEEMDRVKQKVTGCYEEDIPMETNDRIKTLLLDGCCILGFLGILPLPPRTADSTIITLWHHGSIRHDLLLMENQLPFFVLEKIYGLATAGTPDELKVKVDQTIQKLLASYPLITTDQSFHHLLHCCHLKFKPAKANSSSSDSKPTGELKPWRGATDLYTAGIKFKPKQCDPSESLLDVQLVSGRTLMIPTLTIEDSTSSVFRNMIAFEQSCTNEKYFAAYAFFMAELMRTPGDVSLLVKEGVVKNYIGADKEVSDFFNSLVKRIVFDVNGKHFLSSTFEELKSSYNSDGKKHIADLMQNYFRSPWLVISVVAAAIVLVCTIVQTVFAVIK